MQVNFLDANEFADFFMGDDCECLQTIDHGGQLIHVLRYGGGDLLAILNPNTGGAACIYPCAAFDAMGGSIHDQARAILAGAK